MRPCLTSRRFDVVVATERTCFKRSRQAAASGGTRKRDPSRRLDTVRRALGATSRHTLHGLQLLLNPDPRISCRLGGGHGPESVRSSGLVTGRRAPATSRGRAVTHCSNGHVESDSWGGGGWKCRNSGQLSLTSWRAALLATQGGSTSALALAQEGEQQTEPRQEG